MTSAKKVLLFVVEGPSEELAFGVLFDRLFADQRVMFDVVRGDITTRAPRARVQRGGEPNARNRLQNQIVEHIERQPYGWKDLLRIVHIVDTDGAFVDDSCVKEEPDAQGIRYAVDHMTTRRHVALHRRGVPLARAALQSASGFAELKSGRFCARMLHMRCPKSL